MNIFMTSLKLYSHVLVIATSKHILIFDEVGWSGWSDRWLSSAREYLILMDAYRVMKQIGKGSYGQVFLVKHNGSKKQVIQLAKVFMLHPHAVRFLNFLLTFAVCGKEDQTDG